MLSVPINVDFHWHTHQDAREFLTSPSLPDITLGGYQRDVCSGRCSETSPAQERRLPVVAFSTASHFRQYVISSLPLEDTHFVVMYLTIVALPLVTTGR